FRGNAGSPGRRTTAGDGDGTFRHRSGDSAAPRVRNDRQADRGPGSFEPAHREGSPREDSRAARRGLADGDRRHGAPTRPGLVSTRRGNPNRRADMPEKATRKRAQGARRQGEAPTTQAGEFVREEIEHVREGKHGARSAKQAIAIGLSKAR